MVQSVILQADPQSVIVVRLPVFIKEQIVEMMWMNVLTWIMATMCVFMVVFVETLLETIHATVLKLCILAHIVKRYRLIYATNIFIIDTNDKTNNHINCVIVFICVKIGIIRDDKSCCISLHN